jgi:HAE1 family hydrophobic/amphiphilic exporter-1/multidrug efflux pump
MIASKILLKKNTKTKITLGFEKQLNKFKEFYKRTLIYWLKKKKIIINFLILILITTTAIFIFAPKELMPKEDRGAFFVIIKAPQSSGFEFTSGKAQEIESFLLPEVGKGEYKNLILRVPGFGRSSTQVNSGFIIILLEHWDKRKRTGQKIMMESFQKISRVPGVLAFPVMPQGIRSVGIQKPVQFVILGNTYEELIKWKEIIKKEARKNKNLINIEDDFNRNKPVLNVKIDQKKSSDLGVSTVNIGKSIETIFGSRKVTKFTKDGKEYDIIIQGDIKNRKEPSNLNKIYVRSKNTGKLISISNLVSLEEEGTAPFLVRYNRQKAVTISANVIGEYTLTEALSFLENITKENTPNARVAYKGESEELKETSYQIYLIFALALLTAYLVMAAQFESFKHPFTIMLTVPLAIFGGILGLLVVGSSINIFSQIALVILIGLAAKNGILIVEFANQLRDEGKDIEKAIIDSANIRLRPILMTSLSTIFGVLPLIISSGPGEASRLTVGITILAGMMFSTFFTLYIIPAIYLMIGKNTKSINYVEKELKKQLR